MNSALNQSICIITVQFGKLPSCVELWIESCKWNPNISFLVYSDISITELPKNIRWITGSMPSFKDLAETKLGMSVCLSSPYDCCDLKTVYGIIFEDYIQDYDYWGYCDMDMLFGDLTLFFNKYNLGLYDKFHNRGHLSLMRNTDENNNRYKLPCVSGRNYSDAFTTPGTMHFDELVINQIYNSYGFPFFDTRICADIAPEYHRMRLSIRATENVSNYKNQVFYWQNGKVWRAYFKKTSTWRSVVVEEFAYIHFQKRNMNIGDGVLDSLNGFYICSDGFINKTEIGYPKLSTIKKLNPYHCGVDDFRDMFKIQLKRLSKKISFK